MTSAHLTALQYGFIGFLAIWTTLLLPQALGQHARHGRVLPRRLLRTGAVTLYGCLALAVVLLPVPAPDERGLAQTMQLVPFQAVADVTREVQASPVLATPALQQLAANVLLFLPLGVFAKILWRRGFTGTVLLGFTCSALVEITQLSANFGTAPQQYRIFDVDDLLTNTAGAALGWVAAALLLALRRGRRGVTSAGAVPPRPAGAASPAHRAAPAVPACAGPYAARPGDPARPPSRPRR